MMNTSGYQGGRVNIITLFILLVLSYPKPKGRIGNKNGKSGKPKTGASPFAVIRNTIVGLESKMKSLFEGFKVKKDGNVEAWEVKLDPCVHTKERLISALDDDNYISIIRAINGKWSHEDVYKRITNEKNLKNREDTLLTNIPDLSLGNHAPSSERWSGASCLDPQEPLQLNLVQLGQSSEICTSRFTSVYQPPDLLSAADLSLPSPQEQNTYDPGMCKCIVACISLYMSNRCRFFLHRLYQIYNGHVWQVQ